MDKLVRDVRYGTRMLLKKPLFTFVAIVSLALGIAANTAVFSILNAALLRPYPHIDTNSWVYVWERPHIEGLTQVAASAINYRDWKEQSKSFTTMSLWQNYSYSLSGPGIDQPELLNAILVTPDIFKGLNLVPAAGRLLVPSDAQPGAGHVAVISYNLWQHRFGGDPTIVGRKVDLNLVPHEIVGVAPKGFSFPPEATIDVWTAYPEAALNAITDRAGRGFRVGAKLKPGVSLREAQSEMDTIAARLEQQYPEDKGYGVTLQPMREAVAGNFKAPLLTLAGALAFVLLLTCINIANLQLVRLEARRKELAIRTALGAGPAVLVRELLTESFLLVVCAGAAGILLAPVGVRLLLSLIPPNVIPWLSVTTDRTVLLVSLGITLLTAIVSSLAPAIRASRVRLTGSLTAGWGATGAGAFNTRLRNSFLVAQVALTVIPLTGAGLLIGSLIRLARIDPGFQVDHRISMTYYAPRSRYPQPDDISRLGERILDEVRHIPGVVDAGSAQYLPFAHGLQWLQAFVTSNPKDIQNPAELPHVRHTVVGSGYFEAMGIPLKAGRTFTPADDRNAEQVVVINESAVKKFFNGENPVGKQVWVGHSGLIPTIPPRTVIGVVSDSVIISIDESPASAAWVPISQQVFAPDVWRSLYLIIHTTDAPTPAVAAVRERLRHIDPDIALADISTMPDRITESLWRQRLTASTMGALGAIALAIALLGVFAIVSYLVSQRSYEIGVRIALGAPRGNIFKLIMGQGLALIAIGIVVGVVGSLWLTSSLASLLYGVSARDPLTFAGVSLLIVAAGVLACFIPARRATRVDPVRTLKAD